MQETLTILAAAAGGILPALAWLWFWRREDSEHPEPRRLIALAFFAGMLTVAAVIPIQKFAAAYIQEAYFFLGLFSAQTLIFTAWSIIEEVAKFIAAWITVLWRRENNEPIDPVIYMVTAALGFAGIETTLFLLNPDLTGNSLAGVIQTGNLRFVGASLLHILASAVIGVMMGFAFYEKRSIRIIYATIGVVLASVLHAAFNFFILNTDEGDLLRTFAFVWLGVILLLAILEFVKRLRPRSR
jgi:protease PrsW